MLERVIVHVGTDKTGTTSLQQTFASRADILRSAGLCYPTEGVRARVSAHYAMVEELLSGPDGTSGPHWHSFREEALRSGCPTAFFSAEGILVVPIERAVDALNEFARFAKRVDVLIYLRHPVHYIDSAVSQALRFGRTFDEIFDNPPRRNIRETTIRWRRALRRSNAVGDLLVRGYGRDVDPTWELVGDALAAAGCNGIGSKVSPVAVETNRRFSVLAAHLLDWINRQPRSEPLPAASLAPLNLIEGPGYRLPEVVRSRIRAKSAPDLAWLKRQFNVVLTERPITPPPPVALSEEELASLATVLLGLTQFAYEVEHSRFGHFLGLRSPMPTRALPNPVFQTLQRLRLLRPLLGPHGRRARTVEKRHLRPLGIRVAKTPSADGS